MGTVCDNKEVNSTMSRIFESLGEAWLYGLRNIMENGTDVDDEYVNVRDISLKHTSQLLEKYKSKLNKTKLHLKLKEVCGYSITIKDVDADDPIIKKFANRERIDYTKRRYGRECGEGGYGNFIYGENGHNVNLIIERLQQNPHSKSAVITSPNSWHGNEGKPPCLTAVSFLIRDSKLQLFVIYRSQNLYTKQPGNILALRALQNEVAERLALSAGDINLFVCTAHIYESDWEGAKEIISKNSIILDRQLSTVGVL